MNKNVLIVLVVVSNNKTDVQRSVCVCMCVSDLQPCVLSSVELQVLTGSCFKLRTVHNIPVTSNKDGKRHTFSHLFLCSLIQCLASVIYRGVKCKCCLNMSVISISVDIRCPEIHVIVLVFHISHLSEIFILYSSVSFPSVSSQMSSAPHHSSFYIYSLPLFLHSSLSLSIPVKSKWVFQKSRLQSGSTLLITCAMQRLLLFTSGQGRFSELGCLYLCGLCFDLDDIKAICPAPPTYNPSQQSWSQSLSKGQHFHSAAVHILQTSPVEL